MPNPEGIKMKNADRKSAKIRWVRKKLDLSDLLRRRSLMRVVRRVKLKTKLMIMKEPHMTER